MSHSFVLFVGLCSTPVTIYSGSSLLHLACGVPSNHLLCSFHVSVSFLQHFFIFCHNNKFRAYLVLSSPQAWNSLFFQRALCPFAGEWCLETSIWMPGMLTAAGASLFPGPRGTQSWEGCTHLRLFSVLNLSLCIDNHEATLT